MKFFASIKVRLFLISWFFFTIHFATNVVREHYPAFSIVDHFTLKVDEYQGFHPDIFLHSDGHSYIGNNVTASVVAAVPLFLFDPILDLLEKYEKGKIAREGVGEVVYETHHKNSIIFLKTVKERGLTLRFGGATVVTSVFLMAPLSSLAIVLMFNILIQRGVSRRQAFWLSLLFGAGTPLFFRTGLLNHNVFAMHVVFWAFYLLWDPEKEDDVAISLNRRVWAGFLAGFSLALDYSGVIPLLSLFGYLLYKRFTQSSLKTSITESIPFILGSVPPVLFLLYTQWAMFGNPFLPGQFWMPDVNDPPYTYTNPYSNEGFRGFSMPSLDLYFLNLFDPSYGMYVYGPLLVLGLIPVYFYKKESLILPQRERLFVAAFFFFFLTFCAANQYSRIQFNSGFRYLVPLVPLIYLAVCDHLVRMKKVLLWLILPPVLLNSWVISMVRESVPDCWSRLFSEGVQLPWLTVLKSTGTVSHPFVQSSFFPIVIIVFTLSLCFLVWRIGESRQGGEVGEGEEGTASGRRAMEE